MRAEIKSCHSSDVDEVWNWVSHGEPIDYWLAVDIGSVGVDGADHFQVRVVDSETLSQEAPRALRSTIVVARESYSFAVVEDAINGILELCERDDWGAIAAALNHWFIWEYEGHRVVDNDGRRTIERPSNWSEIE